MNFNFKKNSTKEQQLRKSFVSQKKAKRDYGPLTIFKNKRQGNALSTH